DEHLRRRERTVAAAQVDLAGVAGIEERDRVTRRDDDIAQPGDAVGREVATEPSLARRLRQRAHPRPVTVTAAGSRRERIALAGTGVEPAEASLARQH